MTPDLTDSTPHSTEETRDLTAAESNEPRVVVRFFVDLARFGGRQLIRHRAPQLAAALSYRTIFSLVPVLVLSLIVLKALVGTEGVRNGLESVMQYAGLSDIKVSSASLPNEPGQASQHNEHQEFANSSESAQHQVNLTDTIEDFIDKTVARIQGINFGAITIVGVLLLVYAAITLIVQVEQAFNLICRAPSGRRMRMRFVVYWTLLTLGPVFLIGGIVLTRMTSESIGSLPAWLSWAGYPLQIVTKFGLTWIILIAAYVMLPNTRVLLRPAAVGALIATVLWESLKSGLGRFAGHLTDPSGGSQFAVYGSLALIPLFLLWIYITWLIVLFGLELTSALQIVASGRAAALERRDRGEVLDSSLGVVLMRIVADGFATGQPTEVPTLAARLGLAESTFEPIVGHFVKRRLLVKADNERDVPTVTLGRPAESIELTSIFDVMGELSAHHTWSAQSPEARILAKVRQAGSTGLAGLTLAGVAGDRPLQS